MADFPQLEFACRSAETDRYAAGPTILLHLDVAERTGARVHAIVLRCQVRIEPVRRRYDDEEARGLTDLFGARPRWSETLKPLQLAFLTQVVPGFEGATEMTLPMPCSYDVDVAAHKYLAALRDGSVPLILLFSGTVFTAAGAGIAVQPIPWDRECRFELPVARWRETMDQHFPGEVWLRLHRETAEALARFRAERSLLSTDEALELLLKEARG